MVSALKIYKAWSRYSRPKPAFLLVLRAYYRTGQLDRRDWLYVLLGGEIVAMGSDGFFMRTPTVVERPELGVPVIIVQERPLHQAIWRLIKCQIALELVYGRRIDWVSAHYSGLTALLRKLLSARQPLQATNPAWVMKLSEPATRWGLVLSTLGPEIEAMAYATMRMYVDTAPESMEEHLEMLVDRPFSGSTTDIIGQAYWAYLRQLFIAYFKIGQMHFEVSLTVQGHPLFEAVPLPLYLPLNNVGGPTLTTLQTLVGTYAARAPTYPEVMQRLLLWAMKIQQGSSPY